MAALQQGAKPSMKPIPALRALLLLPVLAFLAACGSAPVQRETVPAPTYPATEPATGPVDARTAAQNFVAVVDQMEPVVEAECRRRQPQGRCDFLIAVDDRQGQPPNAYQTVNAEGRPVLAFTLALIADARNRDEIAFVLGHEASHHILGHLPRTQAQAATGAMILGTLATIGGADAAGVKNAQELGASVAARSYSKGYELEADRLGTVLTWRAGFDPGRGAEFFRRLPDPGDRFLGTHPQTADRQRAVWDTLRALQAGQLS